jgi:hypothetical protein
VSVLCNTTEADPDALGEKVAAVFLPPTRDETPPSSPTTAAPSSSVPFGFDLAQIAGKYVDLSTAEVRTVADRHFPRISRYAPRLCEPRRCAPNRLRMHQEDS